LRLAIAGSALGVAVVMLLTGACATRPPANLADGCAIFEEKRGWYRDMKRSEARWGVPVHVQLAIVHQESRFVHDAKPPRRRLLGFIPWRRLSSAYGYAQAQDSTWDWYIRKTGNRGADRDDFGDVADFIGWYGDMSHRLAGIPKDDAYRQYLAFHEGHGGYKRRTWASKPWLVKVARKVARQAETYRRQLARCADDLDRGGSFWPF